MRNPAKPLLNRPIQGVLHDPTISRGKEPVLSPQMPAGWTGTSEANWELTASVARHTLDKGEELRVSLYFCGYGRPDWAKFSFYPPPDVLMSKPDPSGIPDRGSIEIRVNIASWDGFGGVPSDGPLKRIEWAVAKTESIWVERVGGTQRLAPGTFLPLAVSKNPQGSQRICDLIEDEGKRTVGEVDYNPDPSNPATRIQPVAIRAQIAPDAKGGDYSIPFVLSYSTNGRVKSSTFRLDFRVTPFWERWAPQALVYVASGVAIFASAFAVFWALMHP